MTRTPEFSTEERPWSEAAALALYHARHRDMPGVRTSLRAMIDQFGDQVLSAVILGWIDAALIAKGFTEVGDPATLHFISMSDGSATLNADEVHPWGAWAGRMINSRISDDEATFQALIAALPADKSHGPYLTSLLIACAELVNEGLGGPDATVIGTLADHSTCADYMRDTLVDLVTRTTGRMVGKVIVSTLRVVAAGYNETSQRCPHGTLYWLTPDAELQEYLNDPHTTYSEADLRPGPSS